MMYDEDGAHTLTNATLTAATFGVTAWMSWMIAAVLTVLLVVVLLLRHRARRNNS
jgi:hypothetical protein